MELSNCNLYCTGFLPIWGQDLIIVLKFLGVLKIRSVRMLAFLSKWLRNFQVVVDVGSENSFSWW